MQRLQRFAANFAKAAFSSALIIPILFLVFYSVIFFIIRGAAPTPQELIQHFASLYARYGYEIIFFGSLFEALVLINFVVPGATAVILGAVFAKTGQVNLSIAILAAASGASIGYVIDYFLGAYGFGQIIEKLGYTQALEKVRSQIEKSAPRAFLIGFIHPNLGCLTSLASGTINMAFKKFALLMLITTFIWYTVWGTLIFLLGEVFLEAISRYLFWVVFITIAIWILVILINKRSKR